MTDQTKISELTTGAAIAPTDLFYSSQDVGGGIFASVKQSATALATFVESVLPPPIAQSNLVYDAQDHGWLPDGTDHSAAAIALLALAAAGGGGTIYFRPSTGRYRADSQLIIPTFGSGGQASQKNIRLTGAGGGANWYAILGNPDPAPNAAILDLRYNSLGVPGGRIMTLGLGSLVIDNLQIIDGGPKNSTPFIWSTNTTCTIENNAFVGNGTWTFVGGGEVITSISNGTPCVTTWNNHGLTVGSVVTYRNDGVGSLPTGLEQDRMYWVLAAGLTTNTFRVSTTPNGAAVNTSSAGSGVFYVRYCGPDAIVCGGRQLGGTTPDSAFQGYGTVIRNNTFTQLNGGVLGQAYANSITVRDNFFVHNVGLRAMAFDWAGQARLGGEVLDGNLIEMDVYTWGVIFKGVERSYGCNNFWDPNVHYLSDYLLDHDGGLSFTVYNVVLSLVTGGKVYTERGASGLLTYNSYLGSSDTNSVFGDGIASSMLSKGVDLCGSWRPGNNAPGALNIRDQDNPLAVLALAMDQVGGTAYLDASISNSSRKLTMQPRGGAVSVTGPLAVRPTTIALVNGANDNIDLYVAGNSTTKSSWVRITGPTGAFNVTGFNNSASGVPHAGSILHLYNASGQPMTLKNDTTSTAVLRILTCTGADVTLGPTNASCTLIYNDTDQRWVLVGMGAIAGVSAPVTPGGAVNSFQYNSAGFFGGAANFFLSAGNPNVISGGAYLYNGSNAIRATSNNWFFGSSGNLTATGTDNVGNGQAALAGLTTGTGNIGLGTSALTVLTTGQQNFGLGYFATAANIAGNYNVGVGALSLRFSTADENIGIGYSAGAANTSGTQNVFVGSQAAGGAGPSTGTGNVLVGALAGNLLANGARNVAVGQQAAQGVTTGSDNTIIGGAAGVAASQNQVTTGSSNISIGTGCAVASAVASNQLVIGNYIYGTGFCSATGATIATAKVGLGVKAPAVELEVVGRVRTTPVAVGSLPAAGNMGSRHFVNDANATLAAGLGNIVAAGGANKVPVYDDGTNWRIG